MSFISFHFLNGDLVYVNKENISWFSKDTTRHPPKNNSQIRTTDGRDLFVKESVEEVKKFLENN